MKKTILLALFSVVTLVAAGAQVEAAVAIDKTDVGVSFKSEGPIKPGENGPFKDNLAVVWQPSEFQFGEQQAVANTATFNNTVIGEQYMVVNDDRTAATETPGDAVATTSKWSLKANFSGLTSTDASKAPLDSKLVLNLGAIQGYNIGETIDEKTNDLVPNKVDDAGALIPFEEATKVTLGGPVVTLEGGSTTASSIFQKSENGQNGGVATKISDAKLTILNTTKEITAGKSFVGQVSWTLNDSEI